MAPPDPLHELRERVRATQEAAERLAGEARHAGDWSREQAQDDLDALVALLRTLRDVVPAELQQQLTDVMREVLLLLRSLLDYWVARLEAPAGGSSEVEVQDIPVE
ncbi:MAG: hypothetical protein QOI62_3810 [Solirubrobacteraceae bacterium]|jgi:polyhydroxyalkanoate synthesis regulator phasin|nr:hypothetical protein [Solirubrobacteraceae bacterium]MEA2394186.1 hypothetical protein [Solirubrobacteraceae bacterium]